MGSFPKIQKLIERVRKKEGHREKLEREMTGKTGYANISERVKLL